MKILVITSSYPRSEFDISGHFVKELNDVLSMAGNEIQTLAWRSEGTIDSENVRFIPYALPKFETLFFRSGAPENLGKLSNQILVIPAMLAMWRAIVKAERPDVVVGHWALPGGILARLAGNYFGVPSKIIGHSGGLHVLKRMGEISIFKSLILDGPLTIPSTAFFKIAPKATFLPIGFRPIPSPSFKTDSDDALIMSRLEPIKNIERAIRGWSSEGATLHIAGEGTLRRSLERLAKRLDKNVMFHGLVTGEKKKAIMSSVKYFFLPSQILDGRHEGFPIGLLQAIDFGLIPLVAYFPGVGDVLDGRFIVQDDEDWQSRFESLAVPEEEFESLQNDVFVRRWSQIGPQWVDYVVNST